MLAAVPDEGQMTALLGEPLYAVWTELCAIIDEKYDMERLWGSGGKAWTYEINTAAAAKPYAAYTQGKNAWGLC